ncbi:MAG TPA: DNA replication and repair protein RecF, partial [Ignavibacteria bacterium]|nr:DNA replication and repair protein RecF [Ignavibacteria bacterium]
MTLLFVYLKNFRSHKNSKLNFSDGINYIVGGNGQGKTSVLESIYYLCTTKGYNSKSDSEVVRFNENEFEVEGLFRDLTQNNVRIFFSSAENRKYYFLNNKQITYSANVIGKFPIVLLTPAGHSITQGSPSERRRFVDSVISQSNNAYLKNMLDYNKTLRQRSNLLMQIKENKRKILFDELEAWTEKLIDTGSEIIKQRINFIRNFNEFVKSSYEVIMGNDEIPTIKYSFLEDRKNENIKEMFVNLLNEKKDEELRRTANLIGPHRDDFIFEINGYNLRKYGSMGQHKTFQVVLRFAEFFYLKEITGKTSLFLLDDVFGELDINRAQKISNYLRCVG